MALATEPDPVETVRLIVDSEMAAGDWTAGSAPDNVEAVEETERNIKENRQGDDIYCWAAADGSFEQHSAGDSYTETHIVQVEAWSTVSSARAFERAKDIRDYIWSNFAFDNGTNSNWHRIQPIGELPFRHQSQGASRGDHYIEAIQVRLTELRDV